jgi:hypothetical protein
MATEIHQFSATIPAGTAIDSPVSIPLEQANYEIESIDIEVPPGPNGLVGFQIYLDDTPWIPFEPLEWIIWNDHSDSWQTENQVVNGGWNVVGYNLGIYYHTVTVRFHTNPIPIATADDDTGPVVPNITYVSTPIVQEPVLL